MRALILVLLFAQEMAVPTTPVPITITSYRIVSFEMDREPEWRFTITYKDSNDKIYKDVHFGPSSISGPNGPTARPEGAEELIKQLNTADFRTNSLIKRLLQHLVTHGKIPAATVTGKPEGA
jgi:hypothetical protein